MKKKSFTLLELVAVVTVATLLVALTLSVFQTDPAKASQARIGGAALFSFTTCITKDKPVTVNFDGENFIASYIDDDGKEIIFKSFKVMSGVDAKMTRNNAVITSYVIEKGEIKGGNSQRVVFKIKNERDTEALVISISAFTGRVSYYTPDGEKVLPW